VEQYIQSPHTYSWRGAKLKHRDNFVLPLPFLVGVQKVWWEGEGYQKAANYTFFYGKGMLITN
jgi:hypothetical protein